MFGRQTRNVDSRPSQEKRLSQRIELPIPPFDSDFYGVVYFHDIGDVARESRSAHNALIDADLNLSGLSDTSLEGSSRY